MSHYMAPSGCECSLSASRNQVSQLARFLCACLAGCYLAGCNLPTREEVDAKDPETFAQAADSELAQRSMDTPEVLTDGTDAGVTDAVAADSPSAGSGQMAIRISGVQPQVGPLRLAVFTSAASFPDHATANTKLVVESLAAEVEQQLPLPDASGLAVAVFQDLNNDGVLNRSSLGIPTEPFGFSNGAKAQFGPPKFQDAAIERRRFSSEPVLVKLDKLSM